MIRGALLAGALCACGDDGGMTGPDGGDGNGCQRPALDQPWLGGLVGDVVAQLASAPRYTLDERTTARTYLSSQLAQLGWAPQLQSYATGTNVYATIPSTTGATRQVVVGAHFDTVSGSPGANDNATGCAVVMAVARYLQDLPCRDEVVIVAFFDEEEEGLFGARAFASMVSASNVLAVHTIDQVGWDMDNDRRFEIELPTTALEAEYRAAATIVGVPVTKTSTSGTDHQAFRALGFSAVGLTEEYVGGDTSPYRHTAQDIASTVETAYTALAAQLTAQVIMTEL